jgi:hypothetical protein
LPPELPPGVPEREPRPPGAALERKRLLEQRARLPPECGPPEPRRVQPLEPPTRARQHELLTEPEF